ncbi:PAS domain S-box-containing protein [Janthinobacterium sp. CG_23.3]
MPTSVFSDSAGGGDGVAGALQKKQALIKTGALQDAIFNSVYFSSIATDERGVIQIFNVGAERMLGYDAVDIVNRITPADISDPHELVARASSLSDEYGTPISPGFEALVFKASRGIEDMYELTYVRKDGSRFPAVVSVTVLRDAGGSVLGYLLIGTDNTARKQVEAAQAVLDQRLRDQQFYTRSLIESNIDALMMTDPQGIISDVNQQMIALTGRTRDELIGAPSKNFFTDPLQADAAIKRVLKENKVSDYELTVRALNGDETVVSYNAATFHDRDRTLQGVFASARDVTERKRFERALHEKNVELEHASRMKSEFLATMSHELRTPLNAIIGFSEALKDGLIGALSDSQHEYIGDIFTSGQHLLSLINDILDLSKVEAGMMALELDPVEPLGLLSSSLSIVKEKAAAQRISLTLDVAGDLGEPLLDIRKTKQIVYNLLSNAVKFGAEGSNVTLSARRVARQQVGVLPGPWPVHGFALADSEFNEFLEICVGDSGIGISSRDMGKLFQAFSQIDSSLARKFEGTGLGLAMVKQLAELHGGTAAVASAEGEGARFAVWLPLRRQARAAAAAAAAGAAGGAHRAGGRRRRARRRAGAPAARGRRLHRADRRQRRGGAVAGAATYAESDHARLDVARHRRLGIPAAPARSGRPGARAGGDHLRQRRQASGAGRRRRRRAAKTDQPGSVEEFAFQPRPAADAGPGPHGADRRRRPQGRRGDRRVPAGAGLRGGARVWRRRGDRAGATVAPGLDPARPDDAGGERLRRRRGLAAPRRHRADPGAGGDGQADHRARP